MRIKNKQPKHITMLNATSIFLVMLIAILFLLSLNMCRQLEDAHKDRYNLTQNANMLMKGSHLLTNEMRSYAATSDKLYYNNYRNEIDVNKNIETGITNMKKIGLTTYEERIVNNILQLSNNLIPIEIKAMDTAKTGDTAKAVSIVYGDEYKDIISLINNYENQLYTVLDLRTESAIADAGKKLSICHYFIFVLLIILIFLQIWIRITINRRLSKPTEHICKEMIRFSNGNLAKLVKTCPTSSEIIEIEQALNSIRDTFSTMAKSLVTFTKNLDEGDFDARIDTSDFPGDYQMIAENINFAVAELSANFLNVLDACEELGSGNFNARLVPFPGKKSIANQKFDILKLNINILNKEITRLVNNVVEGNLDISINTDAFEGDWKDLAVNLDNLINLIKPPLCDTANLTEQAENEAHPSISSNVNNNNYALDNIDINNIHLILKHIENFNCQFKEINLKSDEIIKLVKDIALNTDFLAFNATTELDNTTGNSFSVSRMRFETSL